MEEMFGVDLTELEWDLSFPCPRCGEAIIPEDKSGRCFSLLGIRIEEGIVQEALIKCNKCGSKIHLEGFELLNTTCLFNGAFERASIRSTA